MKKKNKNRKKPLFSNVLWLIFLTLLTIFIVVWKTDVWELIYEKEVNASTWPALAVLLIENPISLEFQESGVNGEFDENAAVVHTTWIKTSISESYYSKGNFDPGNIEVFLKKVDPYAPENYAESFEVIQFSRVGGQNTIVVASSMLEEDAVAEIEVFGQADLMDVLVEIMDFFTMESGMVYVEYVKMMQSQVREDRWELKKYLFVQMMILILLANLLLIIVFNQRVLLIYSGYKGWVMTDLPMRYKIRTWFHRFFISRRAAKRMGEIYFKSSGLSNGGKRKEVDEIREIFFDTNKWAITSGWEIFQFSYVRRLLQKNLEMSDELKLKILERRLKKTVALPDDNQKVAFILKNFHKINNKKFQLLQLFIKNLNRVSIEEMNELGVKGLQYYKQRRGPKSNAKTYVPRHRKAKSQFAEDSIEEVFDTLIDKTRAFLKPLKGNYQVKNNFLAWMATLESENQKEIFELIQNLEGQSNSIVNKGLKVLYDTRINYRASLEKFADLFEKKAEEKSFSKSNTEKSLDQSVIQGKKFLLIHNEMISNKNAKKLVKLFESANAELEITQTTKGNFPQADVVIIITPNNKHKFSWQYHYQTEIPMDVVNPEKILQETIRRMQK